MNDSPPGPALFTREGEKCKLCESLKFHKNKSRAHSLQQKIQIFSPSSDGLFMDM